MIVTLDINVFLDVFQKREPHYLASSQVMNLVAEGKLVGVSGTRTYDSLLPCPKALCEIRCGVFDG